MGTLLGILSAVGAFGTFGLWFRRIQQVRIPEDRTAWVVAALVSAGLGVGALFSGPGWIGGILAGLGLLLGGFFSLLVGISAQKAAGAIGVGDAIPEVSALDETGATVALSSFSGTPALYKFFRGHW